VTTHFEEGTTLDRFLMETSRDHPNATGQFVTLLKQVTLAGKMISSRVNRAGLAGMLGGTGDMNVQGEFVQKLDLYANDTIKTALEHAGVACLVASEEDEGISVTPPQFHSGRYAFAMDPLDGSSNIDVNATIGTIFAVFNRESEEGTTATEADILRSGRDIVAAGYIIYGSGTVLVLATNDTGVNGFTLDPSVGEFFLSHKDIELGETAKIYSVNEGYRSMWAPGVADYVDTLKAAGRGMSQRYIGSLVADFHRNLLKGGLFLYPATSKNPDGKLRLLYEAFPLAYICERAGGAATDGGGNILDKVAGSLHERTELVIGNKGLVDEATHALSGGQ
jgi:fructose-1,6-bisphosphatase I